MNTTLIATASVAPSEAPADGAHKPIAPSAEMKYFKKKQQAAKQFAEKAAAKAEKEKKHAKDAAHVAAAESASTSATSQFEMCRFDPRLSFLLSDLCEDALDREQYPWVKNSEQFSSGVLHTGAGGSPHDGHSKLHKKGRPPPTKNGPSGRVETHQPRLVVFILGGVTYSEQRVAAEISNKFACDVFVGGCGMVSPCHFFDGISPKPTAERPRPR